jgi:hypothetical protein
MQKVDIVSGRGFGTQIALKRTHHRPLSERPENKPPQKRRGEEGDMKATNNVPEVKTALPASVEPLEAALPASTEPLSAALPAYIEPFKAALPASLQARPPLLSANWRLQARDNCLLTRED